MLIAQMQGVRKAGDVWGSPRWTMASHDGYAFSEVKPTSPEGVVQLPAGIRQVLVNAKCGSSWRSAVRLPQVHPTLISSTGQLVPCSPQQP